MNVYVGLLACSVSCLSRLCTSSTGGKVSIDDIRL